MNVRPDGGPGQQHPSRDEPPGSQRGWQQPGQRRQDRPVSPVRLRPGDLTPARLAKQQVTAQARNSGALGLHAVEESLVVRPGDESAIGGNCLRAGDC